MTELVLAPATPLDPVSSPWPVVRLRHVRHDYGRMAALDGVTLDIPAGRMIGLVGPDGVGKSTMLGLIAGAKALQQGAAEVLGGDIGDAGWRKAVCSRIAFMPQGLGKNLYPDLTVLENIIFFSRLYGQSRDRRNGPRGKPDARHRAFAFRRTPGAKTVGRHAAETRPVLFADPRSRPADPRRADHRRRSSFAPPVLGTGGADAHKNAFTGADERDRRHRLYGGGRAFRLSDRDERRQRAGDRLTRRDQGADRRRHHRGRLRRPAAGSRALACGKAGHSATDSSTAPRRLFPHGD